MISAIFLLKQFSSVPDITEYPIANQNVIAIEAVVNLPKLNPAQRYVLSQSLNIAVQMTPEYGSRDVLAVMTTGTRFRLFQTADSLRIGLTVDSDQLGPGLSLLHSVLTQPTFLEETIKVRKSAWSDPWDPAYSGYQQQEMPLDRSEIAALWQGIMRPKSISIAVSGKFHAGDPTKRWRSMQTGWVYDVPSRLPLTYPPKAREKVNSVPLLVFDSRPITLTQGNIASYFLAANSLGVGKDSILWQVAREEMNLSYRQESFLIPTDDGWRFRLAFAVDSDGVKPESIALLRTNILARCESLTQAELDHAIGLGKGYLKNQIPTLPLMLGIGDTVSNDANDQLFLKLYWNNRFGFDWDTDRLYEQMRTTSLADLKKLLLQIVDESNVRIL